jgi:hypothetical protein
MGMELLVTPPPGWTLSALLTRLGQSGLPCTIVMVDGALVMPNVAPPAQFADVRLKTPAGTLALKRHSDGVAVVAFGNADAALQAAQQQIVEALRSTS